MVTPANVYRTVCNEAALIFHCKKYNTEKKQTADPAFVVRSVPGLVA